MNALHVLVVDDDPTTRLLLATQLGRHGHAVDCLATGEEAVDQLDGARYDVVITDLMMPGRVDGLDLLDHVRGVLPRTEVLVITAHASVDTAIAAMKRGATDYLQKPVKVDELMLRLERLQIMREVESSASDLREALDQAERQAALRIAELEQQVWELQQQLAAR